MSAFIKLSLTSRVANYLHMDLATGVSARATKSALGIELATAGVPSVIQAGGEKDGEVLVTPTVRPNQRVQINLGNICPFRYNVILEPNPKLMEYGTVQLARLIEPDDSTPLTIYFKADRQCNLLELDYFIRIYMID